MNKMVLVPEAHVEELKRLRLYQRGKLPPKPEILQTADIQQKIDKLLTDTNVTPQDKIQLFAEYMLQYNSFKDQATGVDTTNDGDIPKAPTYKAVKSETTKVTDEAILGTIPNSMKGNVKKLLETLDKNANVTWNANGVVSVNGKQIAGSNIVDIMNDAARGRKSKTPPLGWDTVANALKDNNDRINVGNNRWRNLVNANTGKKSKGRHHQIPSPIPSDDEDSFTVGLFDTPKYFRGTDKTPSRRIGKRRKGRRQSSPGPYDDDSRTGSVDPKWAAWS